jgi:hypothetical protein
MHIWPVTQPSVTPLFLGMADLQYDGAVNVYDMIRTRSAIANVRDE